MCSAVTGKQLTFNKRLWFNPSECVCVWASNAKCTRYANIVQCNETTDSRWPTMRRNDYVIKQPLEFLRFSLHKKKNWNPRKWCVNCSGYNNLCKCWRRSNGRWYVTSLASTAMNMMSNRIGGPVLGRTANITSKLFFMDRPSDPFGSRGQFCDGFVDPLILSHSRLIVDIHYRMKTVGRYAETNDHKFNQCLRGEAKISSISNRVINRHQNFSACCRISIASQWSPWLSSRFNWADHQAWLLLTKWYLIAYHNYLCITLNDHK